MTTYRNTIFNIEQLDLYTSSVEKVKQKTETQYTSILYTDLFQTTIPTNELYDLAEITLANGDKQMIGELVIQGYMNDGSVIIPSDIYMRNNLEDFVRETYIRFYLREPTAIERTKLVNLINEDADITVELVYMAFTTSNEYWFY